MRLDCIPFAVIALSFATCVFAREPDRMINVWLGMAPGETTANTGEALPRRPNEIPPATRIKNITQPRLAIFAPAKPNGTAVVVMPGGGYNYVVIDKEGSEVADWLNPHGVTVFVLHYRTKDGSDRPAWQRPLQDGQRAIRLVRHRAEEFDLDSKSIGVMGFSAGGQAAALVTTRFATSSYQPVDKTDSISCRPDFAMLIYPWRLVNSDGVMVPEITVGKDTPTSFLVHAHNDGVTSLSSIEFYKALKQNGIPSEMHIFQSGGHGYGMRRVKGTNIHTWPDRATDWLSLRGFVSK